MSLFGAHMSVAGGYHNAILAAKSHECEALQLFTKNANQWAAKALSDEEVRLFRRTLRGSGVRVTMAHDSYLINLASPDAEQPHLTVDPLELTRARERPTEASVVAELIARRLGGQHRARPRHRGHPTGQVDRAAEPVPRSAHRRPRRDAAT